MAHIHHAYHLQNDLGSHDLVFEALTLDPTKSFLRTFLVLIITHELFFLYHEYTAIKRRDIKSLQTYQLINRLQMYT